MAGAIEFCAAWAEWGLPIPRNAGVGGPGVRSRIRAQSERWLIRAKRERGSLVESYGLGPSTSPGRCRADGQERRGFYGVSAAPARRAWGISVGDWARRDARVGALLEKAEDNAEVRIGLADHGNRGLLQNLVASEEGGLDGEIRVTNSRIGGRRCFDLNAQQS
jgi:hypothetical protein